MKGFTARDSNGDSDRMMTIPPRRSCRPSCVLALPLLLLLLCLAIQSGVGGKTTTILRHTDTLDPQTDGFWTNRTTWNARWVKYWRAKRIYEPLWKKVWTPTIHTEWMPLPNAPGPDAWKKRDSRELSSDY